MAGEQLVRPSNLRKPLDESSRQHTARRKYLLSCNVCKPHRNENVTMGDVRSRRSKSKGVK
jgi:hypothetical protein